MLEGRYSISISVLHNVAEKNSSSVLVFHNIGEKRPMPRGLMVLEKTFVQVPNVLQC